MAAAAAAIPMPLTGFVTLLLLLDVLRMLLCVLKCIVDCMVGLHGDVLAC